MSDELDYSSHADEAEARRKQRLERKKKAAREARQYEPRHYTRRDESFAARLDAGARMTGGDE